MQHVQPFHSVQAEQLLSNTSAGSSRSKRSITAFRSSRFPDLIRFESFQTPALSISKIPAIHVSAGSSHERATHP
jgi:hypothetical protein